MNASRLVATTVGQPLQPLTLQLSDQITRINGVVVRNTSDLQVALYVGKGFAGASSDDVVNPGEIASIAVGNVQQITFGFIGTPAIVGSISIYITSDSVTPYRATSSAAGGANCTVKRVVFPGQAGSVLSVGYGMRSVFLFAIAGGAYVFASPNVTIPLLYDANGVPSDPSYLGQVASGRWATFPLPTGTTEIFLVPGGATLLQAYRTKLGASHIYSLADAAGSPAIDSVGSSNGVYAAGNILYQQPPLYAVDSPYSIASGRNDATAVGVALPYNDPNPGKDFSLELLYKKTADTSGFNPHSFLWSSLGSGGGNGGLDLYDINNILEIQGHFNANAAFWYWQGSNNNLAVGDVYHVVVTWSKVNERGTVYINGTAIVMNGGPGAPSLGSWGTTYTEATVPLNIGANVAGKDAIGNYESFCVYPAELTSTQVQQLYSAISGRSLEIMASVTDASWSPGMGLIP